MMISACARSSGQLRGVAYTRPQIPDKTVTSAPDTQPPSETAERLGASDSPSVIQTTKQTTTAALLAMSGVVITSFVVAALYFGREILIPIALAVLIAFLLNPIATRFERWVGRIAAVLVAVLTLFVLMGGVGWVLTVQVLDLAARLPDYKENIQVKLRSLKKPTGRFDKLSETVKELKKDLPGAEPEQPPPPPEGEGPTIPAEITVAAPKDGTPGGLVQPPASSDPPKPVEVVETKPVGPLGAIGAVLGPVLEPLGTGALVLLLVILIMLQKEDMRARLIRLVGKGNISATTRAMDDAAQRVARYLLMQCIVNATYGLAIGVGLYFIGVPSAFVWGVLATVLRFIPYVGPWIAAAFPIALSFAVTRDWTTPLYTVGLFVFIELLSNNVMEPMLYGSSTGVSSVALIIAAVFWTWLWGAAGLVLATPLTVCLVVMGRHIPKLAFLSVLLSDEQALMAHEEFYHRLLTPDENDAGLYAEKYLKDNSLTALYDSVFIPVLTALDLDCRHGHLEKEEHASVQLELREIIEDLGSRPPSASKVEADKAFAEAEEELAAASDDPEAAEKAVEALHPPTCRVLALPVRAERDELPGMMLAQLLQQQDFEASSASAKLVTGELIELVEKEAVEAVCISVVPPSTIIQARYLTGKLRARFEKLHIMVGLWGATEELPDATQRLRASGAHQVVTTLADAIVQLSKYAAELAENGLLLAPPENEAERLAYLEQLHLAQGEPQPLLDRLTTRLGRILNVPIVLIGMVGESRETFVSQVGLAEDLAKGGIARSDSVCSQVVASGQALLIEDLARDRRFSRNVFLREQKFRFYAGVPLKTSAGYTIGSLCVLDFVPRKFTDHDMRLLQVSAEEVMDALSARVGAPSTGNSEAADNGAEGADLQLEEESESAREPAGTA
jgi:predicted PurR-regulated permease PerM